GLGEALAAGDGDATGAGEALAAGDGVAVGAGEALAAGAGDADGAGAGSVGEGLAEAAGAGLCARTPDSPNDKAAAGISAARARRRKAFILFSPDLAHQGPNPAAHPGSREPRRSNTRAPNSSHDRCVMAFHLGSERQITGQEA
ncbi:hypothetical protein K7461_29865, partial [Pseudomonas fluorescens]|nr:hypothetical protein [Pseudomonas fluorescens]